MSVINKGFCIRVAVEQVLEVQAYPSTPVDSGREEQRLILHETVASISIDELPQAMNDPVSLLKKLEDQAATPCR